MTPFQFAEHVAADLLLDTRPITNTGSRRGRSSCPADDPGPYAPVAHHEATESALASLFAELSNVDEVGLESIEDEGSTAAVLAVRIPSGDRCTPRPDSTRSVTSRWQRPNATTWPIGSLRSATSSGICPAPDHCGARRLHRESAARRTVEFGDRRRNRSGACRQVPSGRPARPPVSRVGERSAAGRRHAAHRRPDRVGHRCGRRSTRSLPTGARARRRRGRRPIGSASSIRRRIPTSESSSSSSTPPGLTANGPDPRRLADSVAGRTLLAAFELPDERWRRDRVMALVSGSTDAVRRRTSASRSLGRSDTRGRSRGRPVRLEGEARPPRLTKQERSTRSIRPRRRRGTASVSSTPLADIAKSAVVHRILAAGVAAVTRADGWSHAPRRRSVSSGACSAGAATLDLARIGA